MERFLKGVAYLEAHLDEALTAADVAAAACYSVFHYGRLFQALTGDTVMGHVRARRLTLAAERLSNGDPVRLIELALDAGFESQAAFTRAFKRQFGMTPGQLRASGRAWLPRARRPFDPDALRRHKDSLTMTPTYTERGDLTVVGLAQPFNVKDGGTDGPAVWRRFHPFIHGIAHRVNRHTLGISEVVDHDAGDFLYSPAVEVSEAPDASGELPDELFTKVLKGGRFAVFTVKLTSPDIGGEIRQAYQYIYGPWADENRQCLRDWYDFEYYDERFDPETLAGEVDIWVPVY